MPGSAVSFALRRRDRDRSRGRLCAAFAASLLVHAWIASEVPDSVSRTRAPQGVLTARLTPLAVSPAVADLATPQRLAPEPVAAPVPSQGRSRRRGPRAEAAPGPTVGSGSAAGWLAPRDDPTYYPARQLDVYPELLAPLRVAYPDRALTEGRSGRALVLLLIDAGGKVNEVAVVEADPPGYFEEAARKTFETAAFSAARKGGVPVKSRVLVHLSFDPREAKPAAD